MRRISFRTMAGIFAGVPAVVFCSGLAMAAESTDDLKQLRQELSKQRAYIEQLEKRLETQEAKAEAKDKTDARERAQAKADSLNIDAGYNDGFYIRIKNRPFSLVANAFAQFTYTLSKPEGISLNNTFDVSLARLAFSGIMFDPDLSYFMQIQGSTLGNNNNITMLDWWMKYNFSPQLALQGGRFVLPYSRQFYTHPGNLLFADLSEADYAFNLPRGIGAHAAGKAGRLSYHLATLNSIRALDAPGQQNFGDEIGVLGRLEFDVLAPYGYYESSPKPIRETQMSIGLAAAFNPIDGGSSFQNLLQGDKTTNLTVDLGFRWDWLTFQTAGYYRRTSFGTAGLSNGNDWGYYSQLGYFVVPEKWELAGRISGVEFEKANNPGTTGDTTPYTLGMNYYVHGHNIKFQSDYSLLDQDRFQGRSRFDHRFRLQTQFLF